MVKDIKQVFRRKIQNKGLLYKRYPSTQHIHDYLINKKPEIQFYELKKIAAQYEKTDNHKKYDELLRVFVPNWNVSADKSRFIGRGVGRDGFNTYRKVEIEGEPWFEKILISFKTHIVDKAIWLQNNLYGRLDKKIIRVPELKRQFKGNVIAVIYYDYLDLPKIPVRGSEKQAVEMAKYLYELSLNISNSDFESIPDYLFDKNNIWRYQNRIAQVRGNLISYTVDVAEIEGRLRKSRLVYTHLDIKGLNMLENNTLIDWDEFGLFPAGMEQANIFVRNILWYNLNESDPLTWLSGYFQGLVPEREWKLFQLSFLYFLYLFGFKLLQKPEHADLREDLIQHLKENLQKPSCL